MTLRLDVIADLENHYRAGCRVNATARATGVPVGSVGRYFQRFKAEGVPHAPRKPLTWRWKASLYDAPPPIYRGPTIIGKRITAAPVGVGADWVW